MKEITLRKWHRKIGILFVLFIAIQAISGLALSFEGLQGLFETSPAISEQTARAEAFWVELCDFVHHGAGPIGAVYRIVLGVGILWMAITGVTIYIRIRRRTRAS